MALSNIFREPRREITEQIVGTVAVAVWLSVGFFIIKNFNPKGVEWVLGFLAWIVGSFLIYLVSGLLHTIGESICNGLARIGADPRPQRQR